MKTLIAAVLALSLSAPAFAGNLDTFVAPEPEPVPAAEPAGGSNAAWLIPLLAVVAIAVAVSSDDD